MESLAPIRAISRGIAVLQAINRSGALSITEIAREVRLPFPTVSRIVLTLMNVGMVEIEPARKRYRATALVATLGRDEALATVARPHIQALTRETGWPVSVSTRIGAAMVTRAATHAEAPFTITSVFPGYSLSVLGCPAGYALLAAMGWAERKGTMRQLIILASERRKRFDLRIVYALLRDAGRTGHAVRDKRVSAGRTSSIAVAIPGNASIGAITLAFQGIAMEEARAHLLGPLRRAAERIGAELEAEIRFTTPLS